MKKVICYSLTLLTILLITGCGNSKENIYLPKEKSEYEAICTRESKDSGIIVEEQLGLNTISSHNYVSYAGVYVLKNEDGSSLEANETNNTIMDNLISGLKSVGHLGVTGQIKDGKIIVNYGFSNYQYKNAKDAVNGLKNEGFSCK